MYFQEFLGNMTEYYASKMRALNCAVLPYALQRYQQQTKGEGKRAGLLSDDDIAAWITRL